MAFSEVEIDQFNPRILIVGENMWPWYQESCADALKKLGCIVENFGWVSDFWKWKPNCSEPIYNSLSHRIQYRLRTGPVVNRVGRRLIQATIEFRPDIIWFYNVQLISPSIVVEMKKYSKNSIFVQYSNDDPFSNSAKFGLWRNYINSISLFDIHMAYRSKNITDLKCNGARDVHLLRSYFIPEADYPVPQSEIPDRYKCDVVFAGHYENDGRVELLEAICEEGHNLNLFGGGWEESFNLLKLNSQLRHKYPITPVTNADYRYAICGAKVALCFLSTLNQDTYTRRNFQIPAMRTAMLTQYTDDLSILFSPDTEAVFFQNKRELLEKLNRLLMNNQWRQSVADAGYNKVYTDGHDVLSRMKEWLNVVKFHYLAKGKLM